MTSLASIGLAREVHVGSTSEMHSLTAMMSRRCNEREVSRSKRVRGHHMREICAKRQRKNTVGRHPSARVDPDLISTTGVPSNASIDLHACAVNFAHRHGMEPKWVRSRW